MVQALPHNIPALIERRLGELLGHVKEIEFQGNKELPNYKLGCKAIRLAQEQINTLSQYAEEASSVQRNYAEGLMERYRVAVAVFQSNPLESKQELVT